MAREHLDMNRIAAALGAERRGTVHATGGWFGAAQLAAEVAARFRAPAHGGRATDPEWTEQRIVRFSTKTLARLETMAERIGADGGCRVHPLQLAALLIERTVAEAAGRRAPKRRRAIRAVRAGPRR